MTALSIFFDEATSNIDVESENDIMREIHELAKSKTVILVSHRLANVVGADHIYVLDHGIVRKAVHMRNYLPTTACMNGCGVPSRH